MSINPGQGQFYTYKDLFPVRSNQTTCNPEEMATYLEACLEETNGAAAFIAKALGDIARAKGMFQVAEMPVCPTKVFIKRFRVREHLDSTQF